MTTDVVHDDAEDLKGSKRNYRVTGNFYITAILFLGVPLMEPCCETK